MKPKQIQISYMSDTWTALVLLTDINRAAPSCRASLEFFGDPILRADDSDEGAICACLKMFARTMLFHSMDGPTEHVMEKMANEEGYFPLDGTRGLLLKECSSWDFCDYDITVEPVFQKTSKRAPRD